MITVFADKYLYNIESLLPKEIDLHLYDPANGIPHDLENAEGLLIRTVNRINENLINRLPDSIRFIATGSAGTDHVNKELLAERNITFADAAGCNARSVAEYVATALLLWTEDFERDLYSAQVGIIGMGHVGTEVNLLLKALDISTVCYDPPKEKREKKFSSAELDEVLSADILTFHTPLTKTGDYPTLHWLDDQKIANHNYELVINTARGGVVDEQTLQQAFINGTIQNFIIDVWENEPRFNDLVANNAYIKTPHIAGYSKQAKLKASKLIAKSLCDHFSLEITDCAQNKPSESHSISLSHPESISLSEILRQVHPIKNYEGELKSITGLPPKEKGSRFNRIRAEYPLRDEFSFIKLPDKIIQLFPQITSLGFFVK